MEGFSENISYLGLAAVATGLIYAGAHEGLEAPPPSGTSSKDRPDARHEVEVTAPITTSEAWLLPVFGSIALLSIWLMLKYLNADWVRFLFALYFTIVGVGAVWKAFLALSRVTLRDSFWKWFTLHEIPTYVPCYGRLFIRFRAPTVIIGFLSLVPSALYFASRGSEGFEQTTSHAILNNIIGGSLAFGMLDIVKVDGFKTGCVLLTGLFFYDIWWVFGTRVMLDVAKGIDAPVLLLWPRSLFGLGLSKGYSMLGLGDIVLPGTFIALCLRFDQFRAQAATEMRYPPQSFPKTYFKTTMMAYVVALNVTSIIVQLSSHAQPALLYLSPACIGSFLFTAWRRHELADAFRWSNGGANTHKVHPARPDADVRTLEADVESVSSVEAVDNSGLDARNLKRDVSSAV